MKNALWLIVILWASPLVSQAAVTINEVAWMGSVDSPNDEWIELYNDGSATDLTGWTLSDGVSFSVTLSGTIASGAYAVLERTDDTSAPGSAFLIYTGALPNSGATLTLRRTDGGIEDQVAGGTDWQAIGGDNTTKDTAQYTVSGWITAVATPGAANRTVGTTPNNNQSSTTTPVTVSSGRVGIPIVKEKQVLYSEPRTPEASVTGPATAYVNQTVTFGGEVSGLAKSVLDSMTYAWNFGDGTTGVGQSVSHQYHYPGRYVVFVVASFGEYRAEARAEVTVLPTTLALTTNQKGDLQISNTAAYEVDLSNYLISADKALSLPNHTILLPNSTITIPQTKLGNTGVGLLQVLDPAGAVVAIKTASPTFSPPAASISQRAYNITAKAEGIKTPGTNTGETAFNFGSDQSSLANSPGELLVTPTTQTTGNGLLAANALSALQNVDNDRTAALPTKILWPYLALAGLIAVGLLGVIARKAPQNEEGANELPVVNRRQTSPFFKDEV